MTDNDKKINRIKSPYEQYLMVTTDCIKNCTDCEIRRKGGFTYSSVIDN